MSNRLDQKREGELQPKRIEYAKAKLKELGLVYKYTEGAPLPKPAFYEKRSGNLVEGMICEHFCGKTDTLLYVERRTKVKGKLNCEIVADYRN